MENIPSGQLLGQKQSDNFESLIHSRSNDDDSSDDDSSNGNTIQPNSDQVGVPTSDPAPNQIEPDKRVSTSDSAPIQIEPDDTSFNCKNSTLPMGSSSSSPLISLENTPSPPPLSFTQSQTNNVRQSTWQRNTQYDPFAFDKGFGHTAKKAKAEMDADLDRNGWREVFQAPKVFEPRSYKKAMKCPDWRKWTISADEELCALVSNGT